MDDEVWAGIEDFPDYAVSTYGKVMNVHTNAVLRPRNNSYGYTRVALRKDGKTHDIYVHHLVAKAFITGYHEGVQIRHVKDNSNNHVTNLRFRRGARLGTLARNPRKAKTRRVKIVETNMVFMTVESCARYISGDVSSIYRVLRGERISHKGFSFEYHYEEQ
jgi:hypothetical protein